MSDIFLRPSAFQKPSLQSIICSLPSRVDKLAGEQLVANAAAGDGLRRFRRLIHRGDEVEGCLRLAPTLFDTGFNLLAHVALPRPFLKPVSICSLMAFSLTRAVAGEKPKKRLAPAPMARRQPAAAACLACLACPLPA